MNSSIKIDTIPPEEATTYCYCKSSFEGTTKKMNEVLGLVPLAIPDWWKGHRLANLRRRQFVLPYEFKTKILSNQNTGNLSGDFAESVAHFFAVISDISSRSLSRGMFDDCFIFQTHLLPAEGLIRKWHSWPCRIQTQTSSCQSIWTPIFKFGLGSRDYHIPRWQVICFGISKKMVKLTQTFFAPTFNRYFLSNLLTCSRSSQWAMSLTQYISWNPAPIRGSSQQGKFSISPSSFSKENIPVQKAMRSMFAPAWLFASTFRELWSSSRARGNFLCWTQHAYTHTHTHTQHRGLLCVRAALKAK